VEGGLRASEGAVDGWTYYCVSDLSVTMYDADAMFPIQPPLRMCALGVRRKQSDPTWSQDIHNSKAPQRAVKHSGSRVL
jgi:hypothetical protein